MDKPPAIDGRVGSREWAGAVGVTGFVRLGTDRLGPRQPLATVGWTDQHLYVMVRVPVPAGQRVKTTVALRDGPVWRDDSVEVHIDRGNRHQGQCQFVVNAAGVQLDGREADKRWSAQWLAACHIAPEHWSAEFAIPWQATAGGPPKPGDVDGLNIAVSGPCVGGVLSWSQVWRSLHEASRYGHVTYATDCAVGLTRLSPARLEAVEGFAVGKGQADVALELRSRTKEGVEQKIAETKRTVSAPGPFSLAVNLPREQGFAEPGEYVLHMTGRTGAEPLLEQQVALCIGPALGLSVQAFIMERYVNVRATLEPSAFPPDETDVELSVSGPQGLVLSRRLKPDPRTSAAALPVPGAALPKGVLTFRARAVHRQTGRAYSVEKVVDSPLDPEWLHTRVGIADAVPAPWTPLQVDGTAVKPWGRVYRFGRSPLPAEVVTRDASVLAGPVALKGRADAAAIEWTMEQPEWIERKPATVRRSTHGRSRSLSLAGTTTVEYDGMVRVDLCLRPTRGRAKIEALWLEVPFRPEHARYLYHFPGRWGSVANSGYLPADGWAHAFKPFVWLGDEDRGFSWFCESGEKWHPRDPNRAITIDREPGVVVLRLHLADEAMDLTGPLRYTFGFQATPVKEPEKTVWDYRITHRGRYGLESAPAMAEGRIAYPAAGRLRREQGTFECWYRPAVDTERSLPRDQRRHKGNRGLFAVQWDQQTNCGLYWNWWAQGLVAYSRCDGKVTHYQEAPFDWKAGEWRHIAMTWGPTVRIYIDGKLLSSRTTPNFYPRDLEQAKIEIGGRQPMATVDEVRILSVALTPTANPVPHRSDRDTLLLDPFEAYGRLGRTPPGAAEASVVFGPAKFGRGPVWAANEDLTQVQWLAGLGVRTVCFHEHWSPYQSYPYVTEENRPRLKSLVDGCHKAGVSLLLYMARSFSSIAPDWDLRSEECLIKPRGGGYHRKPEQRAYTMCWRSPRKQFCLYHLAKMLDEFGHDGWYLDGSEWPMACTNQHHGCGYRAADGGIRPTYDIFATRDFMKRLYVLTRRRRPQGQLNIHNSTVMVIPTLAWGTSTWGGEQLDTHKPGVRTLDILPMDAFRTEFMGRQWGVPSEFLVYENRPYTSRDVLAYTLLHGVLIRPSAADALTRTARLWRLYDAFPLRGAAFYPYWSNQSLLRCAPAGVYATAYHRTKEGLLIFVSNLGDSNAQAVLKLNPAALGCSGLGSARDALAGEPIEVRGTAMHFALPAWRYRALWVRPPAPGP